MPHCIYGLLVALVLASGGITMGCPVVIVSGLLRRRVNPAFDWEASFVAYVYRRWGRARALLMLGFGIALATALQEAAWRVWFA
jgi:hypothetical protein